ncbi:MAG: deoxynucleoside kinase [Bacteroidales bacterium]|nr:deoxynucleoside kinase [Bacteroidales bacterium]MBO7305793.1 deoxynucleoside kinase [Bacteroidales bacterium]MBQ1218470.1 deoxynucleoside kinase [Bacteroidales bacterium]
MHIAVAGNIGSGKTTLTRLLSKSFGWQAQYEEVDYNPYLSDFYNDMQRWAFNLQIYFLNTRFKGIVDIQNSNANVIQDRTIYEDAQIFAANLHTMGLLSTRDFENYKSLFSLMISLVKPPDLLIYLKSSIPNLVSQIQKRGREYESSIRIDYLQGLNERYEEWIESYNHGKKLIINVDELKFEDNPKDLSTIIDMINGELNGLFL